MDKQNVLIIAGYDVLADKSPDHREYVKESFWRGTADEVNLIFVVGGATNPDYPNFTEAEANFTILEEEFIGHDKIGISIEVLPFGNTSAETLQAVKEHLEKEKISVNKLILSAEQSRVAGFLVDALMVGLNDCSDHIIVHGYPFPDSKKDFESQRKKMLMKVMSHYGFPFNIIRRIYQWFHQRRVAWIKRKQAKALRKS